MPTTEEVAVELDKIENSRTDFVAKYSKTISENVERAKLRVRSIEEHLEALKENYNFQKEGATKSLNDAKLVLSSLEAANAVIQVEPEGQPAPETKPVARKRARRQS